MTWNPLKNLFAKNKTVYRAIKLYSIDSDQDKIDRAGLVEAVLTMFTHHFSGPPKEYDIHGPYGVRKGSSIGIKAFRNKLQKFGHAKYYALHGYTEELYGFDLSLGTLRGACSELMIWYSPEHYSVDFQSIVQLLVCPLNVTSGFCIDIPDSFDIYTETKIKRGIFGGTSITVSYEHLKWLAHAKDGQVRDLFSHNICNKIQSQNLEKIGVFGTPLWGELSLVDLSDENERNKKRLLLTALQAPSKTLR